jgi:hypothetical protein
MAGLDLIESGHDKHHRDAESMEEKPALQCTY